MKLLKALITQQRPSSFVHVIESWNRDIKQANLEPYLQELWPHYPSPPAVTYLLFDDAQDTYPDQLLWNSLFKDVEGTNYQIVLFCSYGSPTGRPTQYLSNSDDEQQDKETTKRRIGTPLVFRESSQVSLHPKDDRIGLLLSRKEFDEVLDRRGEKLSLDEKLRDLLFNWTNGHAGAVSELLHIITQKVGSFFLICWRPYMILLPEA